MASPATPATASRRVGPTTELARPARTLALALALALAGALPVQAALPETLTLDEALQLGRERQPALRAARAAVDAAEARGRQAFAPLLPGVSLGLGYRRQTGNFAGAPGSVPGGVAGGGSGLSAASYDYWSGNLGASVTLWDFGQTWHRYQSALSVAEAQDAERRAQEVSAGLSIRGAWYAALAQQALVATARETLDNTERHLAKVQGFVAAGTRPEIDLAQSRAERANARVALAKAEGAMALAKAKLQQVLGLDGVATWRLDDSGARPALDAPPTAVAPSDGGMAVASEPEELVADPEALFTEALAARPEVAALEARVRAQELSLRAVGGAYWPSLSASVGASLAATQLASLVPNVNGQLSLAWPLYQGGQTQAQEVEGRAALAQLAAQRDALRLQVRLEVEQARVEVASSSQALAAAAEARAAARERLRLAEGRYQSGVGSSLERGDALLADTSAAAQQIAAAYALATARAQLAAALGRR